MRWGARKERPAVLAPIPVTDDHGVMAERAEQALAATVRASMEAQRQAEEAQRLFGAIRREIAITKAGKEHPA